MVRVKALRCIHDLAAGRIRPVGEEFSVSRERADELKGLDLIKELKPAYETKEEKFKATPKEDK